MVQKHKELVRIKKKDIRYPPFTKEKDNIEYLEAKRGLISKQNELKIGRTLKKMRGRLALEYAIKTHNRAIAGMIYLKMLEDLSEKKFIETVRKSLAQEDAEMFKLFKDDRSWLKILDLAIKRQDDDGIGHIIEIALDRINQIN